MSVYALGMLVAAALCILGAVVCLRQAARGWDVASNGLTAAPKFSGGKACIQAADSPTLKLSICVTGTPSINHKPHFTIRITCARTVAHLAIS